MEITTAYRDYLAAWAEQDTAEPAFLWGMSQRKVNAGRDALGIQMWVDSARSLVDRAADGSQLLIGWDTNIQVFTPVADDDAAGQDAAQDAAHNLLLRLVRYLNLQHINGALEFRDSIVVMNPLEGEYATEGWGYEIRFSVFSRTNICNANPDQSGFPYTFPINL